MGEPKTQLETITSRVKSNPVVASLIIFGTIVIALSTFTDAAKNLFELVTDESRPDINAEWVAEVVYPFNKVGYVEKFSFDGAGNELHGSASFLENEQIILEGNVVENRIEFKTKTKEFSPDWGDDNTKLATHHYRGRVLGNEIKFTMETYGGFSSYSPIEFTAKISHN